MSVLVERTVETGGACVRCRKGGGAHMAKPQTKNLLLVRSGQTDWDAAGRVQGATDLPLSSGGRAAIETEVHALTGRELDLVLSAPDEASRETARILAIKTGAKVTVLADLAEPALGLWEGMTYDDLEKRFCRAGRLFLEDPCGVVAPEGDSLLVASDRIMKAFIKGTGKVKLGCGVGVVVRPIALGVVRCALNEADIGELWSMVTTRPALEWYTLQKHDPRLGHPPRTPRRVPAVA